MAKILYDKVNKRTARIRCFIDEEGNYWVDTDPFGVDMSGNVRIRIVKSNDPQFEVRNGDF